MGAAEGVVQDLKTQNFKQNLFFEDEIS